MATAGIVFIHGMFMTGRSWAPWVDRFTAAGYRCTAPSWPGRDEEPRKARATPDPRLRSLTLAEVVAQFEAVVRAEPSPPALVGHSMGGLVVQMLLARGLGKVGVAIDSAPPFGVRSFAISHLRSNTALLWPSDAPIVPSVHDWKYAFWHTGSDDEVQRAYDAEVVPESRRVGRAPLGPQATIDFAKPRAPLLLVGGELDHIIPASLNRANAARYDKKVAPTEYVEMRGRTHYLCGQPGWEEVADVTQRFVETHAS